MKVAQESLRLSSNQQAKLAKDVMDYKAKIEESNKESETYRLKIQKLTSENSSLSEDMRVAQDNLRLSANNLAKLNN